MSNIWKRLYLIILCAVMLSGCSMAVRPGDSFVAARDDFVERLRWGDYQGVGRYLEEKGRIAFLEQFSGVEDLRFVQVDPVSAELTDENRRAVSWTMLEYYRLPSVVVKKYRLRQEWAFRDGAWRIVSPFPVLP
jgi:hypothetical protein